MSVDLQGGLRYELLKNHYDADDYISIFSAGVAVVNGLAFTDVEDYYVVGTCAYISDSTVAEFAKGWTLYTHSQPAAPIFLQAILAAVGLTWPASTPAFEAKDLLFWADQNCWIRFAGQNRVRHYIPANTYMRFHRRCFMFWVIRDTVSGTLRAWMEG